MREGLAVADRTNQAPIRRGASGAPHGATLGERIVAAAHAAAAMHMAEQARADAAVGRPSPAAERVR